MRARRIPGVPRRWPAWLAGVWLALWASAAAAQSVQVTASVDDKTVGTEEMVVYTIEIRGAQLSQIETPQPPETEGLALVQRFPATSRNISVINGQMQQSIGFQWRYRPLHEGAARIEAATVAVGGETYRTDPIALTVVPQARRPRRRDPFGRLFDPPAVPDDPEPEPTVSDRDLFIRVIPSARRAYQNEQVTVEYQLFFRDGIQLRQSRLTDSWDAEGFWREELDVESRPIPRVVVENGLRYNTIVLKRAAVFPTRAGTLHIDPLRIETEAIVPTRSRDPFARFFSPSRRFAPIALASAPLTVEARPLPDGAPDGFRGAVGQFQMRSRVDRTSVEVGHSVQVTVVISGTGNLATLEAPPFEPPGVFERYDPQVAARIDRSGRTVRGSKTFTYVLVPRSNGRFELPPVTFTYFDPRTGRYRTLRDEARSIEVTGTAPPPVAAGALAAGLPVDDIAGLQPEAPEWRRLRARPLYASPLAYALLLIPLLLLGGLAVHQHHRRRLASDRSYARNRRAHPLARKHLRAADECLRQGEARAFYAELERAVRGFVGNRLDIAETGLTHAQLDDRLAAAGIPDDLRQELRGLLEACDRVRFAPVMPDHAAMEADRDRAGRLIVALDERFKQPAAAGR